MTEPTQQTEYNYSLEFRQLIAQEMQAQVQAAIAIIQQEAQTQAESFKVYVKELLDIFRQAAASETVAIRQEGDISRDGIKKATDIAAQYLQDIFNSLSSVLVQEDGKAN